MNTTVQIDAGLVQQIQQRAAEVGLSVDQFIESTLRNAIGPAAHAAIKPIQLPVFPGKGGLQPGVDLNNSAALRDLLDEADGPLGR